jgi:hypothetical protein
MSAANPQEPAIPTRYPPAFAAGNTLKVDRRFANFANTDFTYTLYLAGTAVLNKAATADADGVTFHLVLAPTDTAPLNTTAQPAPYAYVERLSDTTTGEIYDVRSGRIMVNPNFATVAAGAMVSFEEQTLAVIESVLQNRITADIEQYAIAGRSITKIPVRELLQLRGQYRALVWKQRNPGKLMNPVEVVFPTEQLGPNPQYLDRFTDSPFN